jgi:hypothetical protein
MDVSDMMTKMKECDVLIEKMNQSPLKTTIQSAQSILDANNNIIKSMQLSLSCVSLYIYISLCMLRICYRSNTQTYVCTELTEAPPDLAQEEKAMLIEELNSNLSRVCDVSFL